MANLNGKIALACDLNIISRTGQVLNVGNLSREYGFTDIDGTQPPLTRLNGQESLESVQKKHLKFWTLANWD